MSTYQTLRIEGPSSTGVATVFLSNGKVNAMSSLFFQEIGECFTALAKDTNIRCCVLRADGKYFTVGLDLKDAASSNNTNETSDSARKALKQRLHVLELQATFTTLENCPFPIIFACHGACIGGGIDLSCCCDIRVASKEAWFCIKEVDVGLAADLGTLQRIEKLCGNASTIRELSYTARKFTAMEAKELGLLSTVYENNTEMLKGVYVLAEEIASKSPVAIYGTKINLNYSRDHTVANSLDYQATWSGPMLATEDLPKSFIASLQKKKATYSKL